MQISDPNISVAEKQNWVWSEITRRFPEFKRENFPIDDPHTLAGMILDDCCRYIAKPGAIVMDIGANCGVFTTICAVRGAKVWAFEPHEQAFQMLKEIVRRNQVEANVLAANTAIWTESGTIQFNPSSTETDGWLSCNGASGIGTTYVPAISFRFALTLEPEWDCVKMDIEGAEFDVLLSAGIEDLRRIKYLTLDLHHTADSKNKYLELISHLNNVFKLTGKDRKDDIYYSLQGARK